MARSIWNGTITFGLMAVPIKVHSATEDQSVHFHQLHAADGARIRQKRICSKEGREVPYKEVAMGYEVRAGRFVVLSQEEINAAAGERAHMIELEEFVRREQIDPVFYDRTYYLGAGNEGADAYRLLHDALERSERVGIGRWVFHNREYLAAIRSLQEVLVLHTMRFAEELVAAKSLKLQGPSRRPGKRELDMAASLIDALYAPFDPHAFKDSYRERLLALIDAKAKGKEPKLPERETEHQPGDLMAALQASLDASRRPKTRAGS